MFPKTKKDFLNSFTENTILTLVVALREEEIEKAEEERRRKIIEQEKLKIKFNEYESKKNNQPKKIEIPLKEIKKEEKQEIKEEYSKSISQITNQNNAQIKEVNQKQEIKQIIKPRENIANLKIPQKQTPLQENEIDFGKIIFLIRDPSVTYIECPSENQNIIIKKNGQTFKTQITLTKEEMIAIITAFSTKTRIPLVEGLLNARYENIEISAIVSNIISPSFIIKKYLIPSINQNQRYLQRPAY